MKYWKRGGKKEEGGYGVNCCKEKEQLGGKGVTESVAGVKELMERERQF